MTRAATIAVVLEPGMHAASGEKRRQWQSGAHKRDGNGYHTICTITRPRRRNHACVPHYALQHRMQYEIQECA
eukprot:2174143-Pyramimonas_sp.AAC.1